MPKRAGNSPKQGAGIGAKEVAAAAVCAALAGLAAFFLLSGGQGASGFFDASVQVYEHSEPPSPRAPRAAAPEHRSLS